MNEHASIKKKKKYFFTLFTLPYLTPFFLQRDNPIWILEFFEQKINLSWGSDWNFDSIAIEE